MELSVVIGIVVFLVGIIGTWFWTDRSRTNGDVKELQKDVDDIKVKQQTLATHDQVREMIRESIEPLRQDQKETVALAREISTNLSQLQMSVAVQNALQNQRRGNNNDSKENPVS